MLRAIAEHKIPLSQIERWLNHLSSCSPCFQDFRRYRAEAARGRRRIFQVALAAAAVVLVIIGGLLWVSNRPSTQMAVVTIDLRERSVARGDNPAETNQTPFDISRHGRHLVLELPIGSKEGGYEVALLGSDGEEIKRTTGVAQLENHIVTLKADLDIGDISPGSYVLGVRQPGLEWSRYPVRVK